MRISRLIVGALAVAACWVFPGALGDTRSITVTGPGPGPGEVAINASPPFADPIVASFLRPSSIDGRPVLNVWTLREAGAQATTYQVVPGFGRPFQVVVTGDRVLDQGLFPRGRTGVDIETDALGRPVYMITIADPLQVDPGDFNQDGARSVEDIFEFLAAWQTSSPRADLDGSGYCEPQDIFEFIGRYFGAG